MQVSRRMLRGNSMRMKGFNHESTQVLCTSFIYMNGWSKWNINASISYRFPSQVQQYLFTTSWNSIKVSKDLHFHFPILIQKLWNIYFLFPTTEIDSSCHDSIFQASEAISLLLRSLEAHFMSRVHHQYIKPNLKSKLCPGTLLK